MIESIAALLIHCILLAQDDPAKQARDLIERLGSGDVEEREEAERRLKKLGKAAAAELQRASKEGDREIAARAQQLLRRLSIQESLPPRLREAMPDLEDRLVAGGSAWTQAFLEAVGAKGRGAARPDLKNEDLEVLVLPALRGAIAPQERAQLCKWLGWRRFYGAKGEIIKLLPDPDAGVRAAAIWALRDLCAREAIPELVKLLKDDQPQVLQTLSAALVDLHAIEGIPDIARLLKDERPVIREGAIETLARMKPRRALPELIGLMEDPNGRVRSAAAEAAGNLRDRRAVPGLLNLLKDDDAAVRSSAVHALDELRARQALPAIRAMLKDPETGPRAAALLALGALGDSEARSEAAPFLRDPEKILRANAAFSLGMLRALDQKSGIEGLLNDPETYCRAAAAWCLRMLSDDGEIIKLLQHESTAVLANAARAAGDRGLSQTAARLKELMSHKDSGVSSSAMGALGALGIKEAVPDIRPRLKSKDYFVRMSAARALGDLGAREAISDLLTLLKDSDERVVHALLECLSQLQARAAVPNIIPLLKDPVHATRVAAAAALVALGSRDGIAVLLDEGDDCFTLNAVRMPQAWDRLREVRVQAGGSKVTRGSVEEWGRKAGLEVVWTDASTRAADFWIPVFQWAMRGPCQMRLLQGLQSVYEGECEVVLEEKGLRVISKEESLAFWKSWWEREQDKK